MSTEERRLADTHGRFLVLPRGDTSEREPTWRKCRLLLSNQRLILVEGTGKRTYPLREVPKIRHVTGDGQTIAGESTYTRLELDDRLVLLQATDHTALRNALDAARIDGVVVQVRQIPSADGPGAAPEWTRARVAVDEDGNLTFRTATGEEMHLATEEVRGLATREGAIDGTSIEVISVEHGEPGAVTRTLVAAAPAHRPHLSALLRRCVDDDAGTTDLDEVEARALTALYSGVSPFDVPGFIDADVEAVEAAFDRLVDRGVLDEVRVRREVTLTSRGRNLASETIGEG